MKRNDFNKLYEYAKTVTIMTDDFLNCAGYIWLNLTTKQHMKMYNLLLTQGAKETVNKKGVSQIQLSNGLGLLKIEE